MIIGRRRIYKVRKHRTCTFCGTLITQGAVRYFGSAEKCDPKGMLFYHPRCDALQRCGYTTADLDESNPYTQHERSME